VPAQSRRVVYKSGEWEGDLARRELRARGIPVPIGGRAFEIIEVLVQSAVSSSPRTTSCGRVWPGATAGGRCACLQSNFCAIEVLSKENRLADHELALRR
jgi:hypothetical protein